jgi:protein Mpv17
LLDTHPVKTQAITSGFLFAIGDISAQKYEETLEWRKIKLALGYNDEQAKSIIVPSVHHSFKFCSWLNWNRLFACTMFGFCIMGPGGHYWYTWLDRFTASYYPLRTGKNIVLKVFLDTAIFNPIFLIVFFGSVSIMEGMSLQEIGNKLYRDFVPSYAVDCSVWPAIQTFNFRFMAVKYQLLVVNLGCYFDDVFLSYVQHNGNQNMK